MKRLKDESVIFNLSITLIANGISLLGSILLTLILPKFIGVEQYGYYQLYIFYASYIGFLSFGWIDGIYLRYGGKYYNKIDKPVISGQWRLFSFIETIIGLIICINAIFLNASYEKSLVYLLVGLCIVIYLPRAFLHDLLQSTNRIREYANSVIMEKSIHICITCIGLFMGSKTFLWFISSEIMGRLCATCYILMVCKDLICTKPAKIKETIPEIKLNISCGISLMFANIASMLIIGIVRQAIVLCWNVQTFSRVSLTLSISNLLMTFVNSVALVLFPLLRRKGKNMLAPMYYKMRTMLTIPTLGMLALYYPLKIILSIWLPKYAESLKYMAILFPMLLYESKMSMLINTYMKTLRKERILLYINIITVFLSSIITAITCVGLHDLSLSIFSIIILLAFRCTFAEILLSKYIKINVKNDILIELILTGMFIYSSWYISGIAGAILYLITYVIYFLIKWKDVRNLFNMIKNFKIMA